MGQNIILGFCTEVVVAKKNLIFDQDQHIKRAFESHFGKNLFKSKVKKDYYQWTADPNLLKDGAAIADFMQVQFKRANEDPSFVKDTLEAIRSIKSYKQLVESAKNHKIPGVGIRQNPFDSLSIKNRSIEIITTYIDFYAEGKIYMEGYDDFLQYMTRNLHLANQKFPCSKLARFFIL